ncbi:LamG-like jellyroll fold domain-containing protein [Planctomicrobium sp. SH527]|uniref:LamG domain-containing protein n=1 Tax=Planctomicrobium sp. SH527 TaxID=3448123 RepID=UPI003F5BE6A1
MMLRCILPLIVTFVAWMPVSVRAEFLAGAAVVDVTPDQLPVIVNGSMTSRSVSVINTRLNARAIAFADGNEQLVIVVVDSCMMPRELLDEAKKLASDATGIRPDRILISATHSHTAAASMGCLGTDADPNYVPFLRAKLVEAVKAAKANLEPAQIGHGVIDAEKFTALRRWIRRPDRVETDPFGNRTVRANMHAGRSWPDVVGESGPEDPDLSLIAVQSKQGRPLAVLANFSMHYFGDRDISADYFGLFSEGLKERIAPKTAEKVAPFVGIMSHGCSGDIYRTDYTKPDAPENKVNITQFTGGLLDLAMQAYKKIEYKSDVNLAMAESRLPMNYRVPDQQRLEWAKRIVAEMGDRLPKTQPEIYAREQVLLNEWQSTEVVVQAIRIGEIAIATTPNETYALTGLKIKKQSPLAKTVVIELANGGDGYIPPPEQHLLGGYNTWAARSAGLEVTAEPRIAAAALDLLETVSGKPRRPFVSPVGEAAKTIRDLKPEVWYRLDEFAGPRAKDSSGNHRDGIYEPHVAYFLEGPSSTAFASAGEKNRAAHFTGERLRTSVPELGNHYSVSMWIWNGMPTDGRDVTGWMFSRGRDHVLDAFGDHLGLGGKAGNAGRLIFQHGNKGEVVSGKTEVARWTWAHVVLVRDGEKVRVYLNGNPTPEIETTAPADTPVEITEVFAGGRCDNSSNWEGRLDEVAIFKRALTADEVAKLAKQ